MMGDPREKPVVVIGAGGAGLAAALAAAEEGAGVTLLEKRAVAGGNTAMARGIFAADSPVQRRMEIEAPRDELFRLAMSYAHWTTDPRIVRAFISKSGDTIRWLEEKGLRFTDVMNYNDMGRRTFHVPEGRGHGLVGFLSAKCREAGVRILYKTEAKKLLLDGGVVTGAVAVATQGVEEKELTLPACAVVIATGGYAGSRELLKKYYPHYTDELCLHGAPNTGDGILMAMEAGAATEGLGILHLRGPRFAPSEYVATVVDEPNTVWVNKKGERFVDEAITYSWPEAANALNRQPERSSFTLFDDAIKRRFVEEGVIKGVAHYPPGTKLTELDARMHPHLDEGIKVSDSWEEIARWMGANAEALERTVAEYNAACDRGYDESFVKEPRFLRPLRTAPYYAVRCCQSFHGTIGGIRINERMEVLGEDLEPIPGLYAAGIDTGGWESSTYSIILPGSTFGFALSSGRIAGENAAVSRRARRAAGAEHS